MKIKLDKKKSLCLSLTPTISINASINNTTTNPNEFTSIRKRMLNTNLTNNKANNSIHKLHYNFNPRNDFMSKYNYPKHDMIFTQSLGDLSKVRCAGDNKAFRFKKLAPHYNITRNNIINNNTDINDSSCCCCCIKEDKCELVLNETKNKPKIKIKKIKRNGVRDNTHTQITSNDKRNIRCNNNVLQQRKHNYKLSSMLYTKLLTPHQMHLISSTRRQTKRALPTIRNTTTSTTSKLQQYFNTQVIQDFIYKTFPSPCDTQLPSTTHIVLQNVLSLHNYSLFGVFNSHGKDGYHLSCIAKAHFEYTFSSLSTYFASSPAHYTETDIYALLTKDNFALINNAFMKVNHQLQLSQYEYDKHESYFSLLLLFSIGNNIISASIGIEVTGIRLTHMVTKTNKEIINCISLSTPLSSLSSSSLLSPSITTTNISSSNTKCIFISTTELFTKLSQTTICKLLTKAIPFSCSNQPYIATIPSHLHSLYRSSSFPSSPREISFILLYY